MASLQFQIRLRDPAARFRPGFANSFASPRTEGAGNAGRSMHPQPRVQIKKAHERSHHRFTGNRPAFPAQWFYGLLRALPGDHACLTPSPARLLADLTPALGRQNHTTSPYAPAPFVKGAAASTASRPTTVTSLRDGTVRISELIWVCWQAKFLKFRNKRDALDAALVRVRSTQPARCSRPSAPATLLSPLRSGHEPAALSKLASHRGAAAMIIIDSQVHAYEANTVKRPWYRVPNWPDHVTGDEMVAALDKVGVDGAIFISAFSLYRYDASYAVEVQRAHASRLAIVKPVDPDNPDVADVVADWKKTPGAVGIRIMLTKESKRAADDPGLDRIARAALRYGFPLNIHCWDNLDAGTALIDRHPDTRFIIDHIGILQPRTPPAPAQPWNDLPKVLELARRKNAVIKVSGACTMSQKPYPYPDIWDPLGRVFDAWGFDRCLWGTDWTRAFAVVNYAQAVEPFRGTDRLSEPERAMLMGGACAKAYGWEPKKGRAN